MRQGLYLGRADHRGRRGADRLGQMRRLLHLHPVLPVRRAVHLKRGRDPEMRAVRQECIRPADVRAGLPEHCLLYTSRCV